MRFVNIRRIKINSRTKTSVALVVVALLVFQACQSPGSVRRPSRAGQSSSVTSRPATGPAGLKARPGFIRVLLGKFSRFKLHTPGAYKMRRISNGQAFASGNKTINLTRLPAGDYYRLLFSKKKFSVNGKKYYGELVVLKKGGKILAINHLPVEVYLMGVISAEMSPSWPLESLKAQTVAARTYAIRKLVTSGRGKLYDLDNSTKNQVYKGLERVNQRVIAAVKATKGQVMHQEGRPISAFFHSSCGGYTESARNVWGSSDPSTGIRRCTWCKGARTYSWQTFASRSRLNRLARKLGVGNFRRLKAVRRSRSGRVVTFALYGTRGKKLVQGNRFRLALGADVLRSLRLKMKKKNGGIRFYGRGWGHGAGMCQWGAKHMADKNKNYRQILNFYYRNVGLANYRDLMSARSLARR